MASELLYQVALTLVPQIGAVQARILVEHFGNATNIFSARKKDLEQVDGIGAVRALAIKQFNNFAAAESELAFIDQYKIQTLFLNEKHYPKRLAACYDAPTLLYYRGNADLNHPKVVSIIGTRNITDYGKQVTDQLVADLQSQQVLVVSGLAYGVDAVAHKAALHHNLPTVGVLAHGLDTIYPAAHKSLARQMTAQGGLLSEFGKETPPDRHNFPRRNRVVAGLADCTIVVETAIKGGSMITAELANSYNRDVFAIPGRTGDAKSAGCNHLVKTNRAVLITSGTDVIDMMGWADKKVKPKPQRELFIQLSSEQEIIVGILKQKDTVHVDELYLKSGMNSSMVASVILDLEFENIVASLPGKMYRLI